MRSSNNSCCNGTSNSSSNSRSNSSMWSHDDSRSPFPGWGSGGGRSSRKASSAVGAAPKRIVKEAMWTQQMAAAAAGAAADEEKQGRGLRYNEKLLGSWHVFSVLSGTVFTSRRLWSAVVSYWLIALALCLLILSVEPEASQLQYASLKTLVDYFSTIIGFLLGMYVSNSLARWWALRMHILNLWGCVDDLCMLGCSHILEEHECLHASPVATAADYSQHLPCPPSLCLVLPQQQSSLQQQQQEQQQQRLSRCIAIEQQVQEVTSTQRQREGLSLLPQQQHLLPSLEHQLQGSSQHALPQQQPQLLRQSLSLAGGGFGQAMNVNQQHQAWEQQQQGRYAAAGGGHAGRPARPSQGPIQSVDTDEELLLLQEEEIIGALSQEKSAAFSLSPAHQQQTWTGQQLQQSQQQQQQQQQQQRYSHGEVREERGTQQSQTRRGKPIEEREPWQREAERSQQQWSVELQQEGQYQQQTQGQQQQQREEEGKEQKNPLHDNVEEVERTTAACLSTGTRDAEKEGNPKEFLQQQVEQRCVDVSKTEILRVILRLGMVAVHLTFDAAQKKDDDIGYLYAAGLLEWQELELLQDAPSKAQVTWLWLSQLGAQLARRGRLLYGANATRKWHEICSRGRGEVAACWAYVDTRLPFSYVHLLSVLVHINNIFLAVLTGVGAAACISRLLEASFSAAAAARGSSGPEAACDAALVAAVAAAERRGGRPVIVSAEQQHSSTERSKAGAISGGEGRLPCVPIGEERNARAAGTAAAGPVLGEEQLLHHRTAIWDITQLLLVHVMFMLVMPLFYHGMILLAQTISNPFECRSISFPRALYLRSMQAECLSFITIGQQGPPFYCTLLPSGRSSLQQPQHQKSTILSPLLLRQQLLSHTATGRLGATSKSAAATLAADMLSTPPATLTPPTTRPDT